MSLRIKVTILRRLSQRRTWDKYTYYSLESQEKENKIKVWGVLDSILVLILTCNFSTNTFMRNKVIECHNVRLIKTLLLNVLDAKGHKMLS